MLILTIFDVYFLLDTTKLVCYVLLPDRVKLLHGIDNTLLLLHELSAVENLGSRAFLYMFFGLFFCRNFLFLGLFVHQFFQVEVEPLFEGLFVNIALRNKSTSPLLPLVKSVAVVIFYKIGVV